jgi:4-oxalocrotonate tautomerase
VGYINPVVIARLFSALYPSVFCNNKINIQEGAEHMPYVNIRITKDGATAEQKARVISGVTDLLRDVLGKNPQTTFVVIDEVETDNWGIGGETITQLRKQVK